MRTSMFRKSALVLALVTPALVLGSAQGPALAGQESERAAPARSSGPAEKDRPGQRYWIHPDDLAAPVNEGDPEAPDFNNPPTLVKGPRSALPRVPRGFRVSVFAKGFTQPRVLRRAPNGDIFLAESGRNRVLTFKDPHKRSKGRTKVFARGLDRPFGIAFYPQKRPRFVYVGAADRVVRYPYRKGDRRARGKAQVILSGLPSERHWTKDLSVAPDGTNLVVSIGSASNVAGAMPEKTPEEIAAWEAVHGLGAAWAEETDRAVVRIFNPTGEQVRNFATGLRNCSGMTLHPRNRALWCTGNERDHLGSNLVPDHLTRVGDGNFYGWPWYYVGDNEDPAHAGERPDLAGHVTRPDVLIQAHSSTMQMVFYDKKAFPRAYRGDAFATLRGSWNRENRTGYKVVRAIMVNGRATGVYENFMTGFVLDADRVWGRPTGLVVTRRGDLLVSDDANGTLFRVTAKAQRKGGKGRGRR